MLGFRVYSASPNLYLFSPYHNPDLNDRILDCSLTSMVAVQAEDVRASFRLWVIWPLSGVAGLYNNIHYVEFATMSGRGQLVVGSTHARCGPL